MSPKSNVPLMLLMLDRPWPPTDGAELRNFGLLKALGADFDLDLVVLEFTPQTEEQIAMLNRYVRRLIRAPVTRGQRHDQIQALGLMLGAQMPYHSAIIEVYLRKYPEIVAHIRNFPGVVFACTSHWSSLIRNRPAPNWILDQQNADIDFWRVYASQSTRKVMKWLALATWRLADRYYRRIYQKVGGIISVCESDRQLTLSVAPHLMVDVVENGIDCSEYLPERVFREGPLRLLFTGTSAMRNVLALRQFVADVFPLVRSAIPDVELLVGGNFSSVSQAEFRHQPNIRFSGKVPDMRPLFNQSDIYIAPFQETHGSKLKIAEAMAMTLPIVSTPEGIRGFPLQNGESVLIAHNPAEFARHIIDLANDPQRRTTIGNAGRAVALQSIDWQVLRARLRHIVETTWERGSSRQPGFLPVTVSNDR